MIKNTKSQDGFTLVEILISIALMTGLVLIFTQVVGNFNSSNKKIEQSSVFDKVLISQILELRMASFDAIKKLTLNSSDYKCDPLNAPTAPTIPEAVLYTWRQLNSTHEYCVDIESHEFELAGNIIDVKFRSIVRNKATQQLEPANTKFLVMRRAR